MNRPLFKRFVLLVVVILTAVYHIWPPEDKITLGLDLRGGTSYTLQVNLDGVADYQRQSTLDKAIEIIRKRVDPNGVKEVLIQSVGTDRIRVDIPGLDEAEKANTRAMLQRVAYLEFRLVHPENESEVRDIKLKHAPVPSGYDLLTTTFSREGESITEEVLVKRKAELTGKNISRAVPTHDPAGFAVSFELNSAGAEIFKRVTGENKGHRLAIVLDGKLISAPTIQSEISSHGEITGNFSQQEAFDLATSLQNPLETPVKIIEERGVDPSLGADSVKSGLMAGAVGLGLVVLFMAVYYLRAGLIAVQALLINIVLLFGVLTIFKFTLTLPGIAGIILTVGIAVDANVLIYERIREEIRKGKPIQSAIHAGFDRAFGTIVDANMTTLITALVLSWLGTGPVQGFGVTLSAGIVTSVFSACFVSRLIFDTILKYTKIERLMMLSFVKQTKVNFLGFKWPAIFLSLSIVVAGGLIAMKRGSDVYGVDFTGGDALTFKFEQKVDVSEIRNALDQIGLKETYIQYQQEVRGVGEVLLVKVPFDSGDKAEKAIETAFPKAGFSLKQLDKVGSTVGKELQWTAFKGLAVATLGILIYITARFEFAYAMGAVVALLHDVLICLACFFFAGHQLSLPAIGALLTIAGYSLNDTVVVFDRIREEFKLKGEKFGFTNLINLSVNETLSRTLLTSLTTLIASLALFIFGGGVIHDFAFILVVGVVTGTYSSVFIAAPVLLMWHPSKLTPQDEVKSRSDQKLASSA